MNKKIDWSKYGIILAFVLLVVFFAVKEPAFIRPTNLLNIGRQVTIVGICSVGMTLIILSGGVDLSVGSIIGVSSVLGALLMSTGVPAPIAVLASLLVGAVTGVANGFFINEINIAPMIATLGMQTVLRGFAYILTKGMPIYGISPSVTYLGQGYLLGIPVPVFFLIFTFSLGYFLLNKTTFGRKIYGVGGNDEASRLSGIPVKWVKYKIYIIAGLFNALAGILLLARANSGQPKAGDGYEMDVITACVLGGISLTGGEGKIVGVIFGVLIMGVLTNGMILMNVNEYWQWIVKGLVLLAAVTVDKLSRRRQIS